MDVLQFLDRYVKPATGCTEPIAVGYAISAAYNAILGRTPDNLEAEYIEPESDQLIGIRVQTDRDVFKNALSIQIPGTHGQRGMAIAAAMGLFSDPTYELNLFEHLDTDSIEKAKALYQDGKVSIAKVQDTSAKSNLDIEVLLTYEHEGNPTEAYVRIQDEHTHITTIEVNGKPVYTQERLPESAADTNTLPGSLEELIDIAKGIDSDTRAKVLEGIEMNEHMSDVGLAKGSGLGYGQKLQEMVDKGIISDDVITLTRIRSAGAGDARTGGVQVAVMGTAGSGNQGITALIPISTVSREYNLGENRMIEAAMLSHLVTKYVTDHSGFLSALCGCTIKAGIGATAGVAYLLGNGDKQVINDAINLMAANITGVICDGAKESCALKLANAAGTAVESAIMAKEGIAVPIGNGIIVDPRAEITMQNMGLISEAMVPVDIAIVGIMQGTSTKVQTRHEDPFGDRLQYDTPPQEEVLVENVGGPMEDPFGDRLIRKRKP